MQVLVEKFLPTPKCVSSFLQAQRPSLHSICELIEVEKSVMPPIHRHHYVYVEVTEGESVSFCYHRNEVYVPSVAPLCFAADYRSVHPNVSSPTWIREAYAKVQQNERPLEEAPAWPRLKGGG